MDLEFCEPTFAIIKHLQLILHNGVRDLVPTSRLGFPVDGGIPTESIGVCQGCLH